MNFFHILDLAALNINNLINTSVVIKIAIITEKCVKSVLKIQVENATPI